MIRDAHVVFDLSGGAKSEGCAHEVGYARYFLYKPVVRLYPFLGSSVARLEDDYIVASLHGGFQTYRGQVGNALETPCLAY